MLAFYITLDQPQDILGKRARDVLWCVIPAECPDTKTGALAVRLQCPGCGLLGAKPNAISLQPALLNLGISNAQIKTSKGKERWHAL